MTEQLLEIVEHIVGGGGGIPHHEKARIALGNLRDGRLVDLLLEGSHQIAVIHIEHRGSLRP